MKKTTKNFNPILIFTLELQGDKVGKFELLLALLIFCTKLVYAQVVVVPGEMITIPEGNFIMGNENGEWGKLRS